MLLPLIVLPLFVVPAARGLQVHVSLSRVQNAWWKSIVRAFGGECEQVCDPDGANAATDCPRRCTPEPLGDAQYSLTWQSNLVQEAEYLQQLSDQADPTSAIIVSKYCSPNGNCHNVVPDGGWRDGFGPGDSDGRAYVPLIRQGFRIYFLEYKPNLTCVRQRVAKVLRP
eukprot:SAG31_NODE_16643_length_701_cov_1.644518_1_plen_169_part_00